MGCTIARAGAARHVFLFCIVSFLWMSLAHGQANLMRGSISGTVSDTSGAAVPGAQVPYAETASVGVERALPARWAVSGEYRFVHGVHMGRTENSNLAPPAILTQANAPSLGILMPTPQQIGPRADQHLNSKSE